MSGSFRLPLLLLKAQQMVAQDCWPILRDDLNLVFDLMHLNRMRTNRTAHPFPQIRSGRSSICAGTCGCAVLSIDGFPRASILLLLAKPSI